MATTAERRLAELGIELPHVPKPIANFVPWRRDGALVFLAGQVCEWNGRVTHKGKVGDAVDLVAAQEAARICALNLTAALREALGGDLDRVRACVRIGGFVNCVPDFPFVPHVVNGASDFFHALFGSVIGAHARTAIGVAQLPQGASVEVDAIFAVA
nr:RidA family protein [Kaistia soli]